MRHSNTNSVTPSVATHFPSLSNSADAELYSHMFTQDLQIGVVPSGLGRSRHKDFTVKFLGSDDACRNALNLLEQLCEYERHDQVRVVCDAVEQIARDLSWQGCACYEICYDSTNNPYLIRFPSNGFHKLGFFFLQLIPKGDWDFWKKKFVVLPKSKVFYFEMPRVFGGKSGYKKMLRNIKRFSYLGPEFWRNNLDTRETVKGYDPMSYIRDVEKYHGKITRKWGWNRRDWSQERCTEYFTFYKFIKFNLAKAVLREQIILEINKLLSRLNISCQIEMLGIPTSSDIRVMLDRMDSGDMSFTEVSNSLRL